jgi:2-keto-3-deoxy-L-rhamnonate aldolase RhmA
VNVPALVRVPTSDVGMIKRVADTGASGIIVPQIRSAAEVRHVVSACRYSPLGNRGFGPRRASNYGQYDSDAYVDLANKEFFVCVQIENVEALNDLEAILKVQYLDCVVIGPYDLSASMGLMGRVRHPKVVKAIATVITKARQAGLYVGMGMGTEEELAVEAAAMGANWVQCGSDFGYMMKSAGELFGNIRKRALAQSRTTGAPKSPG